jgi:hypothetical protein
MKFLDVVFNNLLIYHLLKVYFKSIFYKINDLLAFSIKFDSDLEKELRTNGYFVINDYLTSKECDEYIQKIDKHVEEDYCWRDKYDSDIRMFGIENIESEFNNIFNKKSIDSIYKKYISRNSLYQTKMAAKMIYSEKNIGSGGGWHRDTVNIRQLKFILYLSDVSDKNGCFQFISKSHSIKNKFETAKCLNSKNLLQRYSTSDVDFLIDKLKLEVKNLVGKKGTLIVVDTSGLHRGKPMSSGSRYAVTNYMSEKPFGKSIADLLIQPKL